MKESEKGAKIYGKCKNVKGSSIMAKYQNYKQKSKARPVAEEKGKAQKGPESIKKKPLIIPKSFWTTLICLLVIAALILVWIGATHGWFPEKNDAIGGEMTLEPYDPLEIDRTKVEVTDENVQSTLESIQKQHAESETLNKGTVQNGDTVNIDYVGTDGYTGIAFDGGTAKGYDLKIGSGSFIDGFESGLIGQKIGSTVGLDVVFPENYQDAERAGRPAHFEVKINSATRETLPEINDALAKEYATEHITDAEEPIETLDALKAYLKKTQYETNLDNAIKEAMNEKETVTSYDEEKEELIKPYIQSSLESSATSFGMDLEQMAKAFGAEDADAYVQQETENTLAEIMWIDQVIKDQKISWTGVDFDRALQEYLDQSGSKQTVQELKQQADPAWLYIYKNLEFKEKLVMDKLKTMVKLVDPKDESKEEATDDASKEKTEAEQGASGVTEPESVPGAAN